jgi:hypothetical protein
MEGCYWGKGLGLNLNHTPCFLTASSPSKKILQFNGHVTRDTDTLFSMESSGKLNTKKIDLIPVVSIIEFSRFDPTPCC